MTALLISDHAMPVGLKFITQLHTDGGYLKNGEYIYCSSCNVDDHVASFRSQLVAALRMGPVVVNVHSGHDSWTATQAAAYFQQVLAIEKEIVDPNVTVVVHETHRQRLMFSPYQTIEILNNPDLADLKLNADLSHWVCVCERLFDDARRDPWWPDLLLKVAQRCHLIHARVGHAEGPQVFDPRRVDLFEAEIKSHLRWWNAIWESQSERGLKYSYVEAEHGPEPYQSYFSLPGESAKPLSEEKKGKLLWDVNAHIASKVSDSFDRRSEQR